MLSVAEPLQAGNLVALEVDLEAVAILKRYPLDQPVLAVLEELQVGLVDSVVDSVVVLTVAVAGAASEVISRIDQAMAAVEEEALATKMAEALHPEVVMAVVAVAVVVAVVEIVVGMVGTLLQMLLPAQVVDVPVVSPQVGMVGVDTAHQALRIEMDQQHLEHQRQMEVGMIHVAHMMKELAAVIGDLAVAIMVIVAVPPVEVAAATWSR
jgi:hypothetical protein